MASEEERAAILAEYKASVASAHNDDEDDFDDEDEAEFDPNAAFSDDDDDGDGEEEEEEEEADYVVLTGSIHLNEEGRIIYSGNWCMKSELDTTNTTATTAKFKLKSQEVCHPPPPPGAKKSGTNNTANNKKLFDIRRPTMTNDVMFPSRRMLIFDGFFFEKPPPAADGEGSLPPTPKENGSEKMSPKKIKERDVELFISAVENDTGMVNLSSFRIAGRGQNEYGQFVLDGTYTPPGELDDKNHRATVICNKTYGVGGAAKKETRAAAAKQGSSSNKRKARAHDDDDSFDEDFDGEERADYTELIELSEDANLSVEELRKKYYGGGEDDEEEVDEDDDGGGKMSAVAKKPRLDEESDDEACGF